jgi:uncharacterized protein (DUF58 family)
MQAPSLAIGRRPSLRERWQRWWEARLPRSDTLVLTQRNVYILPTRPGLMFALTLLVLLIASINYRLNLGYLLTFLLAGAGVVGMHITHGTLRGLSLSLRAPAPAFAGQTAVLDVLLQHTRPAWRYGIGLRVLDRARRGPPAWVWTDVPPAGQALVHLSFTPPRRGWCEVPQLSAETRFPLGIFRVWSLWRPAARVLAYPQPEDHAPPLPAPQAQPGGPITGTLREGLETEGVRAYRRGDPPKRVVWKKVAKTDQLVSRDGSASAQLELWLDWNAAGSLDVERRLSRLCAWVLAADRAQVRYGLRLPGVELAPDAGDAHRRSCLEQLALWA